MHWSNFRSQCRASSSNMLRFRVPSALRVLSRRSGLSIGRLDDGRIDDLALLPITTNRSALRKAASSVATVEATDVLTFSRLGSRTSSRFF